MWPDANIVISSILFASSAISWGPIELKCFLWKNQRGITGAAQIDLKAPRIAESMKDWKLLQQTRESTLCNNWLTAEMNSAERHTECLICDAWLDEESLDRCLKCHAAKCQHCDIDHTFCIKCDFMRPDWTQFFLVEESTRYYGRCPDSSKDTDDCWAHEGLEATATNTRKNKQT